jgi:hypothetical protein
VYIRTDYGGSTRSRLPSGGLPTHPRPSSPFWRSNARSLRIPPFHFDCRSFVCVNFHIVEQGAGFGERASKLQYLCRKKSCYPPIPTWFPLLYFMTLPFLPFQHYTSPITHTLTPSSKPLYPYAPRQSVPSTLAYWYYQTQTPFTLYRPPGPVPALCLLWQAFGPLWQPISSPDRGRPRWLCKIGFKTLHIQSCNVGSTRCCAKAQLPINNDATGDSVVLSLLWPQSS